MHTCPWCDCDQSCVHFVPCRVIGSSIESHTSCACFAQTLNDSHQDGLGNVEPQFHSRRTQLVLHGQLRSGAVNQPPAPGCPRAQLVDLTVYKSRSLAIVRQRSSFGDHFIRVDVARKLYAVHAINTVQLLDDFARSLLALARGTAQFCCDSCTTLDPARHKCCAASSRTLFAEHAHQQTFPARRRGRTSFNSFSSLWQPRQQAW